MSAPYFADESVTLWHGDSLEVLQRMPDQSVDCCVTSPPYFGLRDYGTEGQYGLEASPAEYVETMRALFAEVRRALADDGTLWLNIGDSYSGAGPSGAAYDSETTRRRAAGDGMDGNFRVSKRLAERDLDYSRKKPKPKGGIPSKNLFGIPWRTAFALQDDGWILRNDIIWAKPNGMPESVADRLALKHEHVFMLTKSPRYWFDLDPIREPHAEVSIARSGRNRFTEDRSQQGIGSPNTVDPQRAVHEGGKNPGDVWMLATQPFGEAHFAVMPQALAERAILAGCKPGGTVLDPFSGSGTTGLAATKHGRKYVGIDLSSDYLDLSLRTRFAQPGLFEGGVA